MTPAANLPLVSRTLAANFATSFASVVDHQSQQHQWQFSTDINDTSGKFATGVNDTGNNGNIIRLLRP